MTSGSLSRSAAVCVVVAIALCCAIGLDSVEALPSFGTKIPNGETVPCPPDLVEADDGGCTASGYCFGLGHPNCGGFRAGDRTTTTTILLSPFGEDWRDNGFVWTKELCELDSDGDGYTNGEELGDPCCVWTVGTSSSSRAMLDSVDGFLPSHPGMDSHTPPDGFVFDRESFCAAIIIDENENQNEDTIDVVEDDVDPYDQYYNPDERRESFDFVMKPYPIPAETTTYIDFVFNIPDDAPDLFHVVFGEAIISQPDHLHHFVLNGCTSRIDPSREGLPMDLDENDCNMRFLGQWTPGSKLFGSGPLDSGIILGRGMGVEAIQLNVHYTDGVYEDPDALTYKMATDGVRILYTPDFRPYTIARHHVMMVPYGPPELYVPPNESRYFLAKTCNVETSCRDTSDETLAVVARSMGVGDAVAAAAAGQGGDNMAAASLMQDLSCATLRLFCFVDGQIGNAIQQLCPETCGLCDGNNNPRNPESYRVTSVNYHAHLLGREMYTTLLREDDGSAGLLGASQQQQQQQPLDAVIQKQGASPDTAPTRTIVRDMKSREVWYYDDQSSIPMDYDITRVTKTDSEARIELIQGTEVKAGDKIHVSCVYDSTERSEPTQFGLSTYDEMCLTALFVTFETPRSLLDGGGDVAAGAVSVNADLNLRTFTCAVDEVNRTTDIYQGFLADDEDARNIWTDHPIEDSDMCIFPVENFVLFDSFMTMENRNCPFDTTSSNNNNIGYEEETTFEGPSNGICFGMSTSDDAEFLSDSIAGHTCQGGEYDQRDSNEEPLHVTMFDCLEAGGSDYTAYTCAEAEEWMLNDLRAALPNTLVEYYRTDWWQPRCCRLLGDVESTDEASPSEDDNALPSTASRGAFASREVLAFLATAIVAAIV